MSLERLPIEHMNLIPCADISLEGKWIDHVLKCYREIDKLENQLKLADILVDSIKDHRLAKRTASGKWRDTDLAFKKTMAEYAEARRLTADAVNVALTKYINARNK